MSVKTDARERLAALVEAAYIEGWQTGWSDGIDLAADDERTVEDRWQESDSRIALDKELRDSE